MHPLERPVLVVEHAVDCPPAHFGQWLEDAGGELEVCRPYAGDEVPRDLTGHSALVVLGGPMGANDDVEHAWLGRLKELVRVAAARSVPTLGICLGHQVAAVALGGEIGRNARGKQLGLLSTGWTGAAADDPLMGPLATARRAVHWNDDIVTRLPRGATLLAETAYGEVQAARYAPTVWGVQWHPEADDQVVRAWAEDEAAARGDGVDQVAETHLLAIKEARAALDAHWRPLATGLLRLATERGRT